MLLGTAQSLVLVGRFVHTVFPLVNSELHYWQTFAAEKAAPDLAEQALASIRDKKFHCQGGSIYSLYSQVDTTAFVRLVVALQTISDYLDNLCDRAGISDEAAFRQLHLAVTDALNPGTPLNDYYSFYPLKGDGGYLPALVERCREEASRLPSYHLVKESVLELASLYSDLQSFKHLDLSTRESKLFFWINNHLKKYPGLLPMEFAAAAGSTLGIFMLCAAAADKNLTEKSAAAIKEAYFPWICGLHILLDYFIDATEDKQHGDLNFVAYYADDQQTRERLLHFYSQALQQARATTSPVFAETVVNGLLAMYLSDPKTNTRPEKNIRDSLLSHAGALPSLMYGICKVLRRAKVL